MPFEIMVVSIVAIGCAYELGKRIVERVIQPKPDAGTTSELAALRTEVTALRDEVKAMRQENHDLMLAVDDLGVHRRGHALPVSESAETLLVGR